VSSHIFVKVPNSKFHKNLSNGSCADMCGQTDRQDKFRVCKSMHHHTFKWINQLDVATSQVYYLSFRYSSTCFGHPHAHRQELNNCSSSLWFYRQSVVVAVLLVVVRPARPRPTALLSPSSDSKPEAATAVVVALDDGREDARNMLSCI
jgi:hypothetical protein